MQTLNDLEKNEKNQTSLSKRKIILKVFLKGLLGIIVLFLGFICLSFGQYIYHIYGYDKDYFMIISSIISLISIVIFIFMTIKFFNTQDVVKRKTKKFIIITSIILLLLSLPITMEFLLRYVVDFYGLMVPFFMFLICCIAFIIVFIKMLMTKESIKKSKLKGIAIVIGVILLILCCGLCSSFYYVRSIRSSSFKPIIYLYPTTESEVHVTLGTPENLSHTYPKYNPEKGRNVIANPNGDLENMDTGRKLYALYREGKSDIETNFEEGFVVKGEDTIPFLEEKLAILGLNEREAEEFIVYWLPQMENNEYNLIRFETKAQQDENMPLNITPTPDTVIRVMMDWKAIDEPIDIPEQQLETPERTGFTVVEWGGSPRN